MAEGTTYVIEQLGLALKQQQDAYSQLLQQAQALQAENEQFRKASSDTPKKSDETVVDVVQSN